MTGDLEHLMSRLGAQLTSKAGSDPNGRYHLIEIKIGSKIARLLVSGPFSAEAIDDAAVAALARLCRGRP